MSRTVKRQEIVEALTRGLEPIPFIQAAWFGGSEATGRTDEWSDVDLQVVCDDGALERTFDAVRETLASLSPVEHRYRLPMPTWHGHEQEFFNLRHADPCHFIDLVVIEATNPQDRFLEPERHGHAAVLFDKTGQVRPTDLDREAHLEKMRTRLPELRIRFALFQNLVTKAVRRRAVADAVSTYLSMTVRPLVELLRMRYCPERYDFGLRYLDRDLPASLGREIESLSLPRSVEEIEVLRRRAAEIFDEHARAYDAGAWQIALADERRPTR